MEKHLKKKRLTFSNIRKLSGLLAFSCPRDHKQPLPDLEFANQGEVEAAETRREPDFMALQNSLAINCNSKLIF